MNKVEAVLSCRHSVRLNVRSAKAAVNQETYCRFDGYQTVTVIYPQEWRIVCCDCQYGRWDGQSQTFASRTVDLHMRYHRGHRTFAVYDTITASGGTNRKKLIQDYLHSIDAPDKIVRATVPQEPPF